MESVNVWTYYAHFVDKGSLTDIIKVTVEKLKDEYFNLEHRLFKIDGRYEHQEEIDYILKRKEEIREKTLNIIKPHISPSKTFKTH